MFITKTKKSPYYQLVYEVNGKRKTVSTKAKSKKKAETFLNNFKIPSQKKSNERKSNVPNLLYFKSEYIDYIEKSKSKSYAKSVKLSFNQLTLFFGDISLTQITPKLVDQFIISIFNRSQYAAGLYYRTLKAAFTKAIDWEYITLNPFTKVKHPKVPKKHPVFISIEEFNLILHQTKEPYLRNLFTLAFNSGMRLGEVTNMKWNWIDFHTKIITVKNNDTFLTKSKSERVIPMNPTLYLSMLNHKQFTKENGCEKFVFSRVQKQKLREDFVSKKFKKAVRCVNLNDAIHFHTLRHSFASLLVQQEVSLYIVKELLGHEDLKTTEIYSHLQTKNLFDAVNRL